MCRLIKTTYFPDQERLSLSQGALTVFREQTVKKPHGRWEQVQKERWNDCGVRISLIDHDKDPDIYHRCLTQLEQTLKRVSREAPHVMQIIMLTHPINLATNITWRHLVTQWWHQKASIWGESLTMSIILKMIGINIRFFTIDPSLSIDEKNMAIDLIIAINKLVSEAGNQAMISDPNTQRYTLENETAYLWLTDIMQNGHTINEKLRGYFKQYYQQTPAEVNKGSGKGLLAVSIFSGRLPGREGIQILDKVSKQLRCKPVYVCCNNYQSVECLLQNHIETYSHVLWLLNHSQQQAYIHTLNPWLIYPESFYQLMTTGVLADPLFSLLHEVPLTKMECLHLCIHYYGFHINSRDDNLTLEVNENDNVIDQGRCLAFLRERTLLGSYGDKSRVQLEPQDERAYQSLLPSALWKSGIKSAHKTARCYLDKLFNTDQTTKHATNEANASLIHIVP
ncbi:MAG: hypothetical protein VXY77_00010 [Pseudomonadota bacterium]|nr:hypothetical protein [Pseudomonadota bacterium]